MKKKLLAVLLAAAMAISFFTGCTQQPNDSSASTKDVNLSEIHQEVKNAYGDDYYPNMPYEEAQFFETFGLNKDMVAEYIAECPQISVNIDTFVAVKAVAGQGENVEKALNQHRDTLLNDSLQYPMNQIKIKASQIVRYGDYVFFVMLGQVPADVEQSDDEAAIEKSAKEQTEIGLQVIDKAFQ